MLSRRRFLTATAASAVTASGCTRAADVLGLRPVVRVAVSWSADELAAFGAVLAGLDVRDYGIELIPLGDDIETALGPTSGKYGRRPDLVMLPRPGLVAEHLDDLEPLPDDLRKRWAYAPVWRDLLIHPNSPGGRAYGLPFKLAHKSTVWYRKDVFARLGLDLPDTWSAWIVLNSRLVDAGVPPLALAGADGWALTDIFENVLLGCSRRTYRRLELPAVPRPWTDPAVEQAFRLLGRMWAPARVLAGGPVRSLVQQFPDAVVEVFGHRRAAMVIAADFAEPVVRRFAADRDEVGVFAFPVVDGTPDDPVPNPAGRPVIVGGDVAVLAKPASEHATDLLTRLARPTAPLPWIERYGGFLAANQDASVAHYSAALEPLAVQLNDATQLIAFDLSDQLGALGGSDGLWRVLQDFLVRVTGRGLDDVPSAAEDACRTLRRLEDRLPPQTGRR